MRLLDQLVSAWRAVAAYRMRSSLTLLGIGVGIAAVILLTSIGEGIHRYVLDEFAQFGTNVIQIVPGKVKTAGGPPTGLPTSVRPLTLDDARALRHVARVTGVAPAVWGNSEVRSNGRVRRTTVYGVGSASARIFRLEVRSGEFLPDEPWERARALVVIGSKLKDELYGAVNPLGTRLRIGGLEFRVIGVLASKGQFLGIDLDDTAFIPATRAAELFNREGLTEIDLSFGEGATAASVAGAATRALSARHGREDFTVTTQQEMLSTLSNVLDVLTLAVGALGSVSLLVGGVGIVTIMTIAVAERTAEVGLMVALGATRRAILGHFLGEAVLLAMGGGLLGLALGVGLATLLRFTVPGLPVQTPISFALLAELGAALIGLAAGVFPARRAARLDPVEALRAD